MNKERIVFFRKLDQLCDKRSELIGEEDMLEEILAYSFYKVQITVKDQKKEVDLIHESLDFHEANSSLEYLFPENN